MTVGCMSGPSLHLHLLGWWIWHRPGQLQGGLQQMQPPVAHNQWLPGISTHNADMGSR